MREPLLYLFLFIGIDCIIAINFGTFNVVFEPRYFDLMDFNFVESKSLKSEMQCASWCMKRNMGSFTCDGYTFDSDGTCRLYGYPGYWFPFGSNKVLFKAWKNLSPNGCFASYGFVCSEELGDCKTFCQDANGYLPEIRTQQDWNEVTVALKPRDVGVVIIGISNSTELGVHWVSDQSPVQGSIQFHADAPPNVCYFMDTTFGNGYFGSNPCNQVEPLVCQFC